MNNKFNDILNDTITVSEKIDAHRFSFMKTDTNDFIFYKKMGGVEISVIDRTISDLYEDAITFVEDFSNELRNDIPINVRFSFYYMSSRTPLRITYKNIDPVLILTDLSERTVSGKTKSLTSDFETLKLWAVRFECDVPLIFEGKLTNYQKELISGIFKFEENALKIDSSSNVFNTKFNWLINEIFGKTYSDNSIISGVYIKTKNDNFQFVNPIFEIIFHESIEPISRDFYDLMLMQIKSFLEEYDLNSIDVSTIKNRDLKYIEMISQLFNKFVIQLEPDINPSFLQPNIIGDLGEFNPQLVLRNEETLKLLYTSDFYIEVFKMMLLVLKKPKRTYGLLSIEDVEVLNNSIEKIKKLIK